MSKQLILLKKFKYGRSSEKLHKDQLGLFNEAEVLEQARQEAEPAERKRVAKRGIPKRRPLPDHFPRREVIVELDQDQAHCPHDGVRLEVIGEEVSERLNILPARVEVVRTVRRKYGCPSCKDGVVTAPVPEHILPKAMADVGLLALILVSKYVDALPLYRIEGILKRVGVQIPRCTMAAWVIEIAGKFQVLINLIQERLLEGQILCVDETPVRVMDNRNKAHDPPKKGYMWVYTSGTGAKPLVLYDYQPGRGKENCSQVLGGYQGYLQVDGYAGYDDYCGLDKATRVGCWAHARRKFHEAWEALDKPQKGLAWEALEQIAELYEVEKRARLLSSEERFCLRLKESRPIVDKIKGWLDVAFGECPPQSPTGKALLYLHNQWNTLVAFLQDGRLEVDNNFTENKIRPFAVGRKNWLFSATTAGAQASSVIYTLVESAKANNLAVYDYFVFLLKQYPEARTVDDFERLLPHNIQSLPSND